MQPVHPNQDLSPNYYIVNSRLQASVALRLEAWRNIASARICFFVVVGFFWGGGLFFCLFVCLGLVFFFFFFFCFLFCFVLFLAVFHPDREAVTFCLSGWPASR